MTPVLMALMATVYLQYHVMSFFAKHQWYPGSCMLDDSEPKSWTKASCVSGQNPVARQTPRLACTPLHHT